MIPSEQKIREALLMELYACKDHASSPNNVYQLLVDYFEEQLDDSDFEPYHNSKSRWANAIQVTRNHLVNEGLILTPEQNIRNQWKLSQAGVKLGRELYIKTYNDDPHQLTIQNLPDEIVEEFQSFDEEQIFPEGKAKYALHTRKERNKKLVALKKKLAFDNNPLLPCEICETSLKEKYGDTGEKVIEAHHLFPISQLTEETEMKLDDLILVCPNCHRMIHHKRPWLSIETLKSLLTNGKEGSS